MRQELWALLAVHQAVRRFAHAAAASTPVLDADRLSYLRCVRIARRSVPFQHDTSRRALTSAWKMRTRLGGAGRQHPAAAMPGCPLPLPSAVVAVSVAVTAVGGKRRMSPALGVRSERSPAAADD
ncbi:hypothetical protein GCM10010206_60190 [Streptomyces cinerochromogenes]|nr:hypothetical protein GCM10010206_60190 [Streptomyces cinerochromogenes]